MPDNSKKKDFIASQLAMTKQFEGTGRGRPFYVYNDTKGIPTIGYGINLKDKGNLQYLKNKGYNVNNLLSGKTPIKPKDAEEFTLSKLNSLYDDFSKNYKGFSSISEHGQHTLIDLQYNMGPEKLKEFKLMNAAFQRGDLKTAAAELKNSDYYKQTKTRAQAHYNTLLNPPKPTFVLKPIARPPQEPSYWEEFMTGYNAPFGDTKTDYNFPTRFMEGTRELLGFTDYSSQQKPKKQEYGGEITAEGKKIRKYGPRPNYMNQNPSGMTTGPITQRSIGNTPGGGYMSFGNGGWTYPANTTYPKYDGGGLLNSIQTGLDAAQFVPVLGEAAYLASLPFTTYDVLSELSKGNYKQAGIDALGYIPALKAFKYGIKGEKLVDTTSKIAKQYNKVNNTVNSTNLFNDIQKDKKAKGGYILLGHEYPTYADGGPVTWSIVEDRPMAQDGLRVQSSSPLDVPQGYFLNPGQSRIQPKVFYPSYTPGQNAAPGSVEPDYTLEAMFMPVPKVGRVFGTAAKVAEKEAVAGKTAEAIASKSNFNKVFTETKDRFSKGVQGTSNLAKEVIGELKQGNLNRQSIKQGNEWLENWIQHPATQAKIDRDLRDKIILSNQIKFENAKPIAESVLAKDPLEATDLYPHLLQSDLYIPEIELYRNQAKNFKPVSKEYSLLKQFDENLQQYLSKNSNEPIHKGNWGVSFMHGYPEQARRAFSEGTVSPPSRYGSWISRTSGLPQEKRISTTIHEGTHDWVSDEILRNTGKRNLVLKNTDDAIKKDFLEWETHRSLGKDSAKEMGEQRAHQAYLANPTEMHARVMELRHQLNLTPDIEVTPEYAKSIIDWMDTGSSNIDPKMLNVINRDPKKLSELFNKFWAVTPYAVPTGVAAGAAGSLYNRKQDIGIQKKGGWVGYPDHTMYSSGMERFDRVRDYTKYGPGGSILPYNISDPEEFKRANLAYRDSLNLYNNHQNWIKAVSNSAYNTWKVRSNHLAKNQNEYYALTNPLLQKAVEAGGKMFGYKRISNVQNDPNEPTSWLSTVGGGIHKLIGGTGNPGDENLYRVYSPYGYKKPVRKPIYTPEPEPEYNYIQHSEFLGPQNFKEKTITTPNGKKILRSEFEKQYGSKVTEKQFDKKAKGGKVTWQIID